MSVEQEQEKSPWIWKAALVALPVGLGLSAAIAVGLKVSRGPQTGMEGVTYSANDFDVANLRDATNKAEDLIGERDFETGAGQKKMLQVVSFIKGSLSSINLGYIVQSDEGSVTEGRIWKNYWIDSSEKAEKGTLVVWCSYSDDDESASVAALLSVAEWLRGREFERRVRVAFVRGEERKSVTADFEEEEREIYLHVSKLGQGSGEVSLTGGMIQSSHEESYFEFKGRGRRWTSESDWKMTAGWEAFEAQVRDLCDVISDKAGEKVVLQK